MTEDAELLREYARDRSEAAFARLVHRYVGLVHSVALRQVAGNETLAQDITQSVFLALAKKADALSRHPAISAWLYRSTQYTAIDHLRAEQRRHVREHEAHVMQNLSSRPDDAGDQLKPILDQVIAELSEDDRNAVMLRFFNDQSFAEIGRQLRLTEEAARKRVDRALEKMRVRLLRRGIPSTAGALASVLAAEVGTQAPTGLATAVISAVAGSLAAGTGSMAASAGLFGLMTITKIVGITIVIACGIALSLTRETRGPSSITATPATALTSGPQVAKTIPPPKILPTDAPPSGNSPDMLSSDELAREFSRLLTEPASTDRRARIRAVLTAWGKLAPEPAFAAVAAAGLNAIEKESHEIDVLTGWTTKDPRAAWAHISAQPGAGYQFGLSTRSTNPSFQAIAAALVDSRQTDLALQLIDEISDPQIREGTIVALIPNLMKTDLSRFVSVYSALPLNSGARANAGLRIGRALAQEFPAQAPEFALKLDAGQTDYPNVILGAVFAELGRNGNARIAADWIAHQPIQELRDVALHEYFNLTRNPVAPVRDALLKRLQDAVAQ